MSNPRIRDPTVQRVIVDTVTLNNVRGGDVTYGDVTSMKDSPSQVSISERDGEIKVNMSIVCAHTVNATSFFRAGFYVTSSNVTRER